MGFDGEFSEIKVPFNKQIDPSSWPYQIEVNVKPASDGVVAMQSDQRFGFKVFVQNGRPGFSVLCKSWIATHTTIDGSEGILGN